MIKFYYHPTPNPRKVALLLEELGLDYQLVPVDTSRGEQHTPTFLAINPNGKVPALVDEATVLFDSSAILLHLGEKAGRFMGAADGSQRAELLSWMMLIASGIGPFTGQAVHFVHYAPEPKSYPLGRYLFEAERHWRLFDDRLATRPYILGDAYSIVDIALWGWCSGLLYLYGDAAWSKFPNVKKLFDTIEARPAAERAKALSARHAFKTQLDDDAKTHLFPAGLGSDD